MLKIYILTFLWLFMFSGFTALNHMLHLDFLIFNFFIDQKTNKTKNRLLQTDL